MAYHQTPESQYKLQFQYNLMPHAGRCWCASSTGKQSQQLMPFWFLCHLQAMLVALLVVSDTGDTMKDSPEMPV